MADADASYHKISNAEHSQYVNSRWRFMAGATILSGLCLAFMLIVATRASLSSPRSAKAALSTNFVGSAKLLRAPAPIMNVPARAAPSTEQFAHSINNMKTQGLLAQGFQPSPQSVSNHLRNGNIAPKAFFKNLFGGGGGGQKDEEEEDLYGRMAGKWKKGMEADYQKRGRWVECKVTDVKDGEVMLDVMPGKWITIREQQLQMRKRFGVKGYATSAGKNLKLPPRKTEKTTGLLKKQQEIEADSIKRGIWR